MANSSTKRVLIDKANVSVVAAVSIAAFVTVFSLVAAKALLSQRNYQAHVISAREKARDQLHANITAADSLVTSYQQFVSAQENVIGGSSTGNGERDGDNARIILDALPSKYDFPALATSLEKIMKGQNLTINNITGVDDEANQQKAASSNTPQAVEMPFEIGASGSYDSIQSLIGVFERSIRPFSISKLEFKAGQGTQLSLTLDAKTYYQPEKNLEFKSEVIK